MSLSHKKIKEFLLSFVYSSPGALLGQILNKQGFLRPDSRLDAPEMLLLISVNTPSCLQAGFSWCCRKRQQLFVTVQEDISLGAPAHWINTVTSLQCTLDKCALTMLDL